MADTPDDPRKGRPGRGQNARSGRASSSSQQPRPKGRGRPADSASGKGHEETRRQQPSGDRAGGERSGKPGRGNPGKNESRSASPGGRPAGGKGDRSNGKAAEAQRREKGGEERQPPRQDLELPEEVSARDLDPEARRELRGLPKDLADVVARHLVVAEQLLDEDPELAYRHVKEARRKASRVGMVREACGFAAYRTERWSEALTELRAARRITGSDAYLPVIADCERGMGRPERAVSAARSADAQRLDRVSRVEMSIIESGARRDLGQFDAAVVALQGPELRARSTQPHSARLFYAYADALCDAGRTDEAEEWMVRAAAADVHNETDAGERLAELDGIAIIDAAEDAESREYSASGEV